MGRKKHVLENGVLTLFDTLMQEYQKAKELRKAQAVKCVRNRFAAFLGWMGKTDIALDTLDARLMAMYQVWLSSQNVSGSTSVYYLRHMLTYFNIAKERGMAVGVNPDEALFGEVNMKIPLKKEKPAVGKELVQRLRALDIEKAYAATGQRTHTFYFRHTCAKLERARNLFLFSICAQGMEFVDLCYLRKTDVQNGVIRYVRRMTNQPVEVKVLPMMRKHSVNYR